MKNLHVDLELPLDRFTLRTEFVATASVTGLFGPSGAGKTSVLETIVGLRPEASGRIAFDDEVWFDSKRSLRVRTEDRGIGYVPQDSLLFPHWDVRANLLAGSRRSIEAGVDPAPVLAGVIDALELTSLLERSVTTLSGGERRRVAIGRALGSAPRMLLLDEPLASLDLPLRRRLLPMLRRVCTELTVPMLLVSHEPLEIQALCDEVVALDRGRTLAQGPPATVLTDPRVFPLAESSGLANVLAGRVIDTVGDIGRIAVGGAGGGGLEIVASPVAAAAGADVLIELPVNQILIAVERPNGLSARNLWPAVVRTIEPRGALALVTAEPTGGGEPLIVELTEATPAELDLAPGRAIHLVFKATSCRVYGGRDPEPDG